MLVVIEPPRFPFDQIVMRDNGVRETWYAVCLLREEVDYYSQQTLATNCYVYQCGERFIGVDTLKYLVTGNLKDTSSHANMVNNELPAQPLKVNQQRGVLGRVGVVNCINLAPIGQPERLGYFARNQTRTASGQAHATYEQAEADALAWAAGKPVTYTQHAVVPLAQLFPNGIPKPPTPFKQWIVNRILSLAQVIRGRKPGKPY